MNTLFLRAVLPLLLLTLVGCAARGPLLDAQALPALADISAQHWANATRPRNGDELLRLTPQMRAFVDAHVTERRDKDRRVRQLTRAVLHPGSLGIDYEDSYTGTAAEVFARGRGNCLSLSLLFVAMARYADIDAKFYEVDVVPNWTRGDDIVFATRHVNVGGRVAADAEFVLDFSPYVTRAQIHRRKLADREAQALYYNNLGAGFLAEGDLASAWLHFSHGLQLAPSVSFLWSNLAVVYSRNGQKQAARLALESSIHLDSDNTSALTNLALAHEADGEHERAAALRARIELVQQDNPYFQFAVAEKLLAEGDPGAALERLHAAIRMRTDEPLFFRQAAIAAAAAGKQALAASYERKERTLIESNRARQLRALER